MEDSAKLDYIYQNFYEMIENNAKKFPKKSMIFIDDQKISNLALKNKIDVFAEFLESIGIKKGDNVAMTLENSEEFVVSFFAITKIGAVAVPINTFLKKEELEFIVNDCFAKLLISSLKFSKETKELVDSTKVEKIIWAGAKECLEDEKNINYSNIIKKQAQKQRSSPYALEDTACIVYTSGTTGNPKGAMLSYKNIYSNIVAGHMMFKFDHKDRFIVYLPMFHSFTLSIMTLLPFFTSSPIVVIKSVLPFSNILKQTLLKRVTVFPGVPMIYAALIKAKIPWYFMWFNKIRVFVSGSAPLSQKTLSDFGKKFKKAKLLEGYGLSECSPAVCINRMEKQKPFSVGLPFPSYEVKVVDDDIVEVGTLEVGELIVKGDCVMQGYFNRKEATDETIINGWLKTGDYAKVDEDGFVYIVDRKKDIIISKGINIYPREIEELLYKIEEVDQVAVIGEKDENNDETPIAFIRLKKDCEEKMDDTMIKRFLKEYLANFKIPRHVYFVDELPLNATGKVLKRVLKENLNKKR